MKIDLKKTFKSIDGREMMRTVHEYDAKGNVVGLKDMLPLTTADALIMSLSAANPSSPMAADEAIRRRKLVDRIIDADEIDLSEQDIDRLKLCLRDTAMLHHFVLADILKTIDPVGYEAA